MNRDQGNAMKFIMNYEKNVFCKQIILTYANSFTTNKKESLKIICTESVH